MIGWRRVWVLFLGAGQGRAPFIDFIDRVSYNFTCVLLITLPAGNVV